MPRRRAWFLRLKLHPDVWLMEDGARCTFEIAHDFLNLHAAKTARKRLELVVNSPGLVPWVEIDVVEGVTTVVE